ncbi:MAG TPA: S41 family peptidase [Steroidobacteraceae bacterium]
MGVSAGTFRALSVLTLLCAGGSQVRAAELPLADRQADFKEFVQDVAENYAWPDRTAKPWLTWQERYAVAVDAAATKESLATVIAAALDELHDFHAEVRSRHPDRWLPVPTFADIWALPEGHRARIIAVRQGGDAQRAGIVAGDEVTAVGGVPLDAAIAARLTDAVDNHDGQARSWALLSLLAGRADEERRFTVRDAKGHVRSVTLPVERQFDRAPGAVAVRRLPGEIGLIRFNNSIGEQSTVAAFDAALGQLRTTLGLILDLRDVPSGGDSSVALGIMGRFVHAMHPYQRHRIPNYGQSDVERNWLELVAPRGPFTYDAPVVVLVDHWTGSMGEGMAIGMDGLQRATVVGTRMAQLAGAVTDFHLSRSGIDVAFATEQLYHVNGTLRQDWQPPILVAEPATTPGDPVLERGLAQVDQLLKPHAPQN